MTNPAKVTLRDKVRTNLEVVRDAGALDDNHGGEDWTYSDHAITEATDLIITTVIRELEGRLPKERQTTEGNYDDEGWARFYRDGGYDFCLREVKSILKEMGAL
jgi:hypothetical protein